jgi:hypothetical protein
MEKASPGKERPALKGVHYVTDAEGNAVAVQLDLDEWGEIWEDMCDLQVVRERQDESTIPWSQLKSDLIREGRLSEDDVRAAPSPKGRKRASRTR